jgi:hypothetical protein
MISRSYNKKINNTNVVRTRSTKNLKSKTIQKQGITSVTLTQNDEDKESKQMAEVISLFEKPKPEPWCSFCKAKKSEVTHLFSNGATGEYVRHICGGCVTLAAKKI